MSPPGRGGVGRLAFIAAVCAAPSVASAQQPGAFSGRLSIGVRSVDVDGATTKYREDVNLPDGPMLNELGFVYTAAPGSMVDYLELDASHLGDEPFESVRFAMRKHGAYRFELARHSSKYFYEDTILPLAAASITGSTGGDFHHFDFERVRDTADLEIDVTPVTKLRFGLERSTRTGDSTTTLDVQRDEFELEKPIDESVYAVSVGIEHAWEKLTLIVEERARDYESTSTSFLPGLSQGANTSDPAALGFYFLDQASSYDSLEHNVRILARPTSRLRVGAAVNYHDLELDAHASERAQGTTFAGAPFSTETAGPAAVDRSIALFDFDVTYALGDRVNLVASAQRRTLDQDGTLTFGTDSGVGNWNIDSNGFEAGAEIAIGAHWVVATGWSTEDRDVDYDWMLGTGALGAQRTDRNGLFARADYSPTERFALAFSIEDDSIDDPFTLASPTGNRRYRASGRYRWQNGVALTASYRRNELDNSGSGWTADTEQIDLRVSYASSRLEYSVGLAQMDLDRSIMQLVVGGTRQDLFPIAYAATAEFVDGSARYRLNDTVSLGASFRTYDNAGSFPVRRDDARGFLEIDLAGGYVAQLAYRDIDYTEDGYDDYDARILEIGFGFRW